MEKLFLGFYDSYGSVVNENMKSTGKPMMVRNNYVCCMIVLTNSNTPTAVHKILLSKVQDVQSLDHTF